MKYFILILCLISNAVSATPGRFGGFTYNIDDKGRVKHDEKTTEITENFNNDFAKGINDEPQKPYYLTKNNKTATEKDKYTLVPTYSLKQIHSTKHTIKGKIEDNKETDNKQNSIEDNEEENDEE